ncbi:MAG: hypothetical protein AMXMBFR20_24240 [Planctomycetia bacterium]|jgi:probable HAF family extracellular repeat protein
MGGEGAGVPPGRPYEGITVKELNGAPSRIRRDLFCVTTALVALASTAGIASAATTPSFMGLGTTSTCRFPTVAFGVSSNGSTVVGRCQNNTGNGQFIAFRWTEDTGLVTLGDFDGGGFDSSAIATSADGSVVVGRGTSTLSNGNAEAFRWTESTGLVSLGDLPGGNYFSSATNVSADGSVVVGFSVSDLPNSEAFRWTAQGGMMGLGISRSQAIDLSADGEVIAGHSGSLRRPFRWTNATGAVSLGLPSNGSNAAFVEDLSADGSKIVGFSRKPTGEDQAFVWRDGFGYQDLGILPGDFASIAREVSDVGTRIVGASQGSGPQKAVIWDGANGLRNLREWLVSDFGLNLTGWLLTDAFAISSDGNTIVGVGINPQGEQEAFRAVIPEPATAFLTLAAIAMLRPRRRSRPPRL